MGRPRDTPLDKELKAARKLVKSLQKLDPAIAPKWHAGMMKHWTEKVAYLETLKASRRAAH